MDGIQISVYNKFGKTRHEENYINGKLDGKEIRYNEEYVGGISEETNYKNGKRDGKYISYFKDGKISEEINFKDGMKNGIWIKYRSQKDYGIYSKEFESNYKDNKRDGIHNEYDNNGVIKLESNYKEGLLDGKLVNYVNGKVNSVRYFQNDKQIENKLSENKTNECSSFVLSGYDSAKNNIEKDKKFKYYFEQAEQYITQEGEKSYNAVVNLEQAIYLLEKGDVFTTKVGQLYSNLANCYRIGFKCYEKALYYYKKAPSSSFGKKRGLEDYNIAICYYELNNFEEMRKYLQYSKSSGWNDDFYKLSEK